MDWKKLIADLVEAGLTQTVIAEKCGVRQSTISDLHRLPDRSPSFDLGTKLMALHAALPKASAETKVKAG